MSNPPFNYEDRLVQFVADILVFGKSLPKDDTGSYYFDQMRRATGSAALHYGEAQGTFTIKDAINKLTTVVKELKETRVILKILIKIKYGNEKGVHKLIDELEQLIAISSKMIINKLAQQKSK